MRVASLAAVTLLASLLGLTHGWVFFRSDLDQEVNAVIPPDPQCEARAAEGTCPFYSCFETRFSCGLQGYMNRYGLYYCNRMNHYFDRFNAAGQRFLNESKKCLMDALLPSYVGDSVNCHALSHAAFQSVSSCYLASGFCSIFWDNHEAFSKILQPADFIDLRSIKMWREVVQIAVGCGGEHVRDFIDLALSSIPIPLSRMLGI